MPRKDEDEKQTLSVDDKFELLIAALTSRQTEGALTKDALREIVVETQRIAAESMEKAQNPSNKTHPGISAFSYPEGDRARSRETILPYEVWWNNFPIHKALETHHYRELELMARLQPGEYTVLRRDGSLSPEKIAVIGTKNPAGTVTKLEVRFPVQRGEKDQFAPMFVMLYQMVHADEPLRKTFVDAMNEWMGMTLGETPATVN